MPSMAGRPRHPLGAHRVGRSHTASQVVGEESCGIRSDRAGRDGPSGWARREVAGPRGPTVRPPHQCAMLALPASRCPLDTRPVRPRGQDLHQSLRLGKKPSGGGAPSFPGQLPVPPRHILSGFPRASGQLSHPCSCGFRAVWPCGCELWPGIRSSIGM